MLDNILNKLYKEFKNNDENKLASNEYVLLDTEVIIDYKSFFELVEKHENFFTFLHISTNFKFHTIVLKPGGKYYVVINKKTYKEYLKYDKKDQIRDLIIDDLINN